MTAASRFIHLANGHAATTAAVVPNGEADAPLSSAATPGPAGIPSLPAGPGRPFLLPVALAFTGSALWIASALALVGVL